MDPDSITRQSGRDREYAAACREAGIEPELPDYRARTRSTADPEGIEWLTEHKIAHLELPARSETSGNPAFCFFDDGQKADAVGADYRTGFIAALDILLAEPGDPASANAAEFVRTSGTRALVLSWMLNRGSIAGKTLTSLARELDCTKSLLSLRVRQIERRTGFHGVRQKTQGAISVYKTARAAYLASEQGQAEIAARKAATAERRARQREHTLRLKELAAATAG